MSRAILCGSAMAVGAGLGLVVVKSVSLFHPFPLAMAYVSFALEMALRGH